MYAEEEKKKKRNKRNMRIHVCWWTRWIGIRGSSKRFFSPGEKPQEGYTTCLDLLLARGDLETTGLWAAKALRSLVTAAVDEEATDRPGEEQYREEGEGEGQSLVLLSSCMTRDLSGPFFLCTQGSGMS